MGSSVSACRSRATRPARPDTAVDNLGQSPLPVKRLHEALQSAQVKRQRLSPPYPNPSSLHPIHQLAVHQHIKVQQSIVQQSIVQQHQLNLAHQSLQNLQAQSLQAAQQSLQAAQNLQVAQGLQAQNPASVGGVGTQQGAGATQGALVPPQQPSPRAASPQHKNMELALCQSMDSVNTATTEEEVC
ncbi:jg16278 [Pararge aegeria aegeria]|uniref:Jg16278 protein n=1 Tax=Pararge aegeria aegeria TaxID=348720 RepID=A0A8S4RVJ7_9NEOP|nr:jg16278 [Pararge aegeria aegeria]